MLERKVLTNLEIYNYATLLINNFKEDNLNYPVKVGFYLQKNIETIVSLGREIEKNRLSIIKKYGKQNDAESDSYSVSADNLEIANNELEDLLALTQEVPVNMLKLEWFDGIDMTNSQIQAISFMISEE